MKVFSQSDIWSSSSFSAYCVALRISGVEDIIEKNSRSVRTCVSVWVSDLYMRMLLKAWRDLQNVAIATRAVLVCDVCGSMDDLLSLAKTNKVTIAYCHDYKPAMLLYWIILPWL